MKNNPSSGFVGKDFVPANLKTFVSNFSWIEAAIFFNFIALSSQKNSKKVAMML